MDKVQKTIILTHVRETAIGFFQRAFYRQYFNDTNPPIKVQLLAWQNIVHFVIKGMVSRMRIDYVSNKSDPTKFAYVVQFVLRTKKYDQEELVRMHKGFSREGYLNVHFIHYAHLTDDERSTWTFFIPSIGCNLEDVMVELRDAAASWPIFADVNKHSKKSIKESFDYFMESFHIPMIQEK